MSCSHEQGRLGIKLAYILTFTAMILHMGSHLIPIIVTNESLHMVIEPYLHNPIVTIAAWSFLPLMIYHWWQDQKIHDELHRLQKENEDLRHFILVCKDGNKSN